MELHYRTHVSPGLHCNYRIHGSPARSCTTGNLVSPARSCTTGPIHHQARAAPQETLCPQHGAAPQGLFITRPELHHWTHRSSARSCIRRPFSSTARACSSVDGSLCVDGDARYRSAPGLVLVLFGSVGSSTSTIPLATRL
ncbi:hypothetical protein AALO_G00114250 [Alosa alosa]|uniref:Uncharacterized protein n=1 Tax=Alosa alosa TaxID=278164 RepID=A0AAV6GUB4_9TELE|nr:hypothetical protein AALO_G00114250 [Alosa alosa]